MTQSDGWFDFMVNGGGAVSIQFGKSPFKPNERNVFVPWNEVREVDFYRFFSRNLAGAFYGMSLQGYSSGPILHFDDFVSVVTMLHYLVIVLGPEIILVRGLVKLVPAVAYHFCLNLPATFSQPRTSIISGPSSRRIIL